MAFIFLRKEKSTAIAVDHEMKKLYTRIGLPHHTYVTSINGAGVEVNT